MPDKKDYNKTYYAENKEKILKQLLAKEECPLCGRSVNHQNVKKHQRSSLCRANRNANQRQQPVIDPSDLLSLKDQIAELKALIKKSNE